MKTILSMILMLVCAVCNAQLTGTVRDAGSGEALQGVQVYLKVAKISAQTDHYGTFTIPLGRLPDTLELRLFAYETFKRPITGSDNTGLEIELKPLVGQLREIVVSTGYEDLPLERATGSFGRIDSTLLQRATGTNLLDRLDGIAPSLLFDRRNGAPNDFSIRGLSTLTETIRQPLIVLDNFPYEGDIAHINPNDVESITLLKDAAAASIWGTRAGNGVLVINTKKGRYGSKTNWNFGSTVTVQQRPNLYQIPVLESKGFIEAERFLYEQGFYKNDLENQYNRPLVSPVVELLDGLDRQLLSREQVDGAIRKYEGLDSRDQIGKYLYRDGLLQQYNLQVSGGTLAHSHYSAMAYDRGLENLRGNGRNRLNLRTEQSWKPVASLTVNAGMAYSQTDERRNSPGGYGSLLPGGGKTYYYPYMQLADEEGRALAIEKNYRKSYTDTAGAGKLLDWAYRPLDELSKADNSLRAKDLQLKMGAVYQLSQGFSATLRYQYQNTDTETKEQHSANTYYTRDLVNRFSSIVNGSLLRVLPYGDILDRQQRKLYVHGFRGQLNYTGNFGDIHGLNLLAGAEVREARTQMTGSRIYGYDIDVLTSRPVDLAGSYPVFGGLSGTQRIPSGYNAGAQTNRFLSFYTNVSYTLKSRYVLTASARRDASNLFGVSSNRKWSPLWSIGASWDVAQDFFEENSTISRLKLRGTFGYSGNVNNAISALTTLRYGLSPSLAGLPNAFIETLPNPDLRPEKVATVNLGLDFGIGKFIDGSLEYYKKRATDVIASVRVDPTVAGRELADYNSAILATKGVDLILNSKNLQSKNFNWNTAFWLSYNTNKVERYLYEPSSYNMYIGSGNTISPIEGQHAYAIVSYRYAGLDDQGDPRVYHNGEVSKQYNEITSKIALDDLVFHGPNTPQYFGSLRNDLSWRSWTLSANLSFRLAYWFRRSSISYEGLFSRWDGHKDFNSRWKQPGDEKHTIVPAMVYPLDYQRDYAYLYADVLVERGDHVRLQDMRLSYTLGRNTVKLIPFWKLQLFVYANNLGIIWRANKYGLDPDLGGANYAMPQGKSIAFGLNINL